MNAFQDTKIVEVSCFYQFHQLDRFDNRLSLHISSFVCVLGGKLLGSSEELSGHNAETDHLQQQERDRREGERMPEQETPADQRSGAHGLHLKSLPVVTHLCCGGMFHLL